MPRFHMTQCVIMLAGNGGQGGGGFTLPISFTGGGGGGGEKLFQPPFRGGGVNLILCCVVLISETPAPENSQAAFVKFLQFLKIKSWLLHLNRNFRAVPDLFYYLYTRTRFNENLRTPLTSNYSKNSSPICFCVLICSSRSEKGRRHSERSGVFKCVAWDRVRNA